MHGLNSKYVVVPGWFPKDAGGGARASDIISLKNYSQAEIYLMVGDTITAAMDVTLHQGTSVSSCATALPFEKYYQTGIMLKYDGASSGFPAARGETATGAGTAVGTVYEDKGGILVLYDHNVTAFVDNEVLTFSGGKTAVVDGVLYNEDIMVPTELAVAVNTFSITNIPDVNKIYCIPVNSKMLNQGMDCIEVNVSDPTLALMAIWFILSEPRFMTNPPPTAIYD
ncbi:MAG: hypothetical protein MUP52_09525 [Candidatus Aminicenantes bacterium]|nr:hypothetical protein [Candidatus Aminicenantes bacterium]